MLGNESKSAQKDVCYLKPYHNQFLLQFTNILIHASFLYNFINN